MSESLLFLCVTAVSVDPRRRRRRRRSDCCLDNVTRFLLCLTFNFWIPETQIPVVMTRIQESGIEIHSQTYILFLSLPFSQLESLEKKLIMKMFRYSQSDRKKLQLFLSRVPTLQTSTIQKQREG